MTMYNYPHVPQAILDAWPNCATPDCEYKTCTWAPLPDLCAPCGQRIVGEAAMIDAFNATHDMMWDEASAE